MLPFRLLKRITFRGGERMSVNSERVALAYQKYADMLFRIAFSELGSREDAEDAVQDVFSSFITSEPNFANEEHGKAWFIRSLINRCHDQQRKSALRAHDSIDDHGELAAEDETEKTLAMESVSKLLAELPERVRRVIILHYLEGFSVEETARVLRSTPGAVKMTLSRGRAMLRKIGVNDDI